MEQEEFKISDCISIKEASDILKCQASRIYNSLEKLPHIKIGSTYFIHKPTLDEMLKTQSVDEILPSRAHWDKLTKHLSDINRPIIIMRISDIIDVTGSTSTLLNMPGAWDPKNVIKSRAGAYAAVKEAGYDIAEMKFSFSEEHRTNVISAITFEQIKNYQERQQSLSPNGTIGEQHGLKFPNNAKFFVNSDPITLTARIHLDSCYYVKAFAHKDGTQKKWDAYDTLADAEAACMKDKNRSWGHCLRCFEKAV